MFSLVSLLSSDFRIGFVVYVCKKYKSAKCASSQWGGAQGSQGSQGQVAVQKVRAAVRENLFWRVRVSS